MTKNFIGDTVTETICINKKKIKFALQLLVVVVVVAVFCWWLRNAKVLLLLLLL